MPPRPDRLWFEGHWGFQYYMEWQGAKPLDYGKLLSLVPHDVIAVPVGENCCLIPLPPDRVALSFKHDGDTLPWLTTMNFPSGPGP